MVLVGIALGFDLLNRFAFRKLFNHLELKQVNMPVKVDAHIHFAMVAGVFHCHIHT